MFNANRGSKSGGGHGGKKYGKPGFSKGGFNKGGFGKGGFGGRDSGRPMMHKTKCSECGNMCEVPFKPSGSKPVYCNDCFRGMENAGPRRSDYRDNSSPRRPDSREYSKGPVAGAKSVTISKEQFEILNAKLDKILEMLD